MARLRKTAHQSSAPCLTPAVVVSPPPGRGRRVRALELLEAKLAVPEVRPGTVIRPGLVNRLRAAPQPLVTVAAPAGYGKTTLLSQWAERDDRPFAWVSIDEGDDDPVVLLRYLAAALHTIERLPNTVLDAVAAPGRDIWSTAVPRLASALAGVASPIVIVLDDVQAIRSRESTDLIAAFVAHVPARSALVLAGRALPDLPVPRERAAGGLMEVDAHDLALGAREARLLLRSAGLELEDADLAALHVRTEGWAAGLHLAGLVLRERPPRRGSAAAFTGDDRFVADYFRFEHLSRLERADVRFLTRTAVLESMCGPLCDAVLGRRSGSARMLESLERSSLFVVPLDRQRVWYRYHHLFRETLRAELEGREPELVSELNRRAAAWCEDNAEPEAARRYAAAAGDVDAVARLIATHALQAYAEGRTARIEDWLDGFDAPELLERHPRVAVVGSWVHGLAGRADSAGLWLEAAEHASGRAAAGDGARSIQPWVALLRAAFCADGVDRMLADAEAAAGSLPWGSRWRSTAVALCGVAHLLRGENDRADALLAEALELSAVTGAKDVQRLALTERSLLAAASGDHVRARDLAHAARSVVGEQGYGAYSTSALELAALARSALRAGGWQEARAALEEARCVLPTLTHALPWCSVQALLELARAHMGLLDTSTAATLLSRAEAILDRRPGLGVLASEASEVRAELGALRERNGRRESRLTAAELRLLPLLSTRLSFREIGERLHVSRNTVKTQAIAVYRKLGVSSRNDAIDRAVELGLIDAASQASSRPG